MKDEYKDLEDWRDKVMYKAFERAYKDDFDKDVFFYNNWNYDDNGRDSILEHDFAKKFFGKAPTDLLTGEEMSSMGNSGLIIPAWKYHLQQLILEKHGMIN